MGALAPALALLLWDKGERASYRGTGVVLWREGTVASPIMSSHTLPQIQRLHLLKYEVMISG